MIENIKAPWALRHIRLSGNQVRRVAAMVALVDTGARILLPSRLIRELGLQSQFLLFSGL